jgi:cell division protease FtsH
MITIYGLNDKIGNVSYYDSTGANEYGFTKPYSERTAQTIDEEVSKMIELAYVRAKDILLKNKHLLTMLAEKLLEKEVIFKEDLETIFGKRPFDQEEIPLIKLNDNTSTTTTTAEPDAKAEEKKEDKKDKKDDEPNNDKEPETPKNTLF